LEKEQNNSGFLNKLQAKWKLQSLWQVLWVLLAFACTGTTVLLIKEPIFSLLGVDMEEGGFWKTVLYLLLVLPLYQALLLAYGFVFGQFRFFWEKEKQFIRRMGKMFSRG
jgi:hypothetical protein